MAKDVDDFAAALLHANRKPSSDQPRHAASKSAHVTSKKKPGKFPMKKKAAR